MTSHGMKRTREYRVWLRMKGACCNPKSNQYPTNGALGINMIAAWRDFGAFYDDMGPIPDDCNGISRRNTNRDYDKFNCYWSFNPRGAKSKNKKHTSKRAQKTFKKPVTVCLTLEKDHYEYIKMQSLRKSVELGKLVEPNDLIRDSLIVNFPLPTQYDMFGNKKF